jgi:hypothetical protein
VLWQVLDALAVLKEADSPVAAQLPHLALAITELAHHLSLAEAKQEVGQGP